MFDHAFTNYMQHAYPADELMPISCQGRYRTAHRSRGDIDEVLGNYSLTLVDTLDTLELFYILVLELNRARKSRRDEEALDFMEQTLSVSNPCQ